MTRFRFASFMLLAVLLMLGGLGLILGYAYLRSSIPEMEGSRNLPALAEPAEILRDGHGIVTIRAGSLDDAARALGFAHAQDRLWQMEATRRVVQGRLSEILGARTLKHDRYFRTLGLARRAAADLPALSPELQALLSAYAEGVNAFLNNPRAALPIEFQLLRHRPEPWRAEDSLAWAKLMAFRLSFNWHSEMLRASLSARLRPDEIDFLWRPYGENDPITLGAASFSTAPPEEKPPATAPLAARFAALRQQLPALLEPLDASNSWVIAGEFTQSGKPLLANDPHLALSAPGQWYLVRLETPVGTLAGVTAPGVPLLVLGHNGHIAWGFTTTHSDTQDLFLEQADPQDPDRYLTPGGSEAFYLRRETIAVKDASPEVLVVRESRHGPIVSDLASFSEPFATQGLAAALAWPGFEPKDTTAEALFRINLARNWEEFTAATKFHRAPQQNMVYADRAGNIGFAAPAWVPLRKAGDGSAPVPGWNGDYDWQGYIPFAELPRRLNPADGRIVSANNRIVPEDYPHLLTAHWPPGFRARRIEELLADSGTPQSLERQLVLQMDALAPDARALLPHLMERVEDVARHEQALKTLDTWNGVMDRGDAAPLLYRAWIASLNRRLLADDLGGLPGRFAYPDIALLQAILDEAPQWCDDRTTPEPESCTQQVTAALADAVSLIEARSGSLTDARWGDFHKVRFPHFLLDRVPLLNHLFALEAESDGGDHTVNRGMSLPEAEGDRLFEHIHGAGLRAVYDLADLDRSRFMIAPGQSGNPLSRNYRDLIEPWIAGKSFTLGPVTGDSSTRLLLQP